MGWVYIRVSYGLSARVNGSYYLCFNVLFLIPGLRVPMVLV